MLFKEWVALHKDDDKLNVKNIITKWNDDIKLTYKFELSLQEMEVLSNEISTKLITLGNFDMLYDVLELDDDNDILNYVEFSNILKYSVFKLSGDLKNLTNYKDTELEEWQSKVDSDVGIGYSGYDLTNQDGAYQKNSQVQKNNDKIRYYSYLNKRARYLAEWVYEEIKLQLLRRIY